MYRPVFPLKTIKTKQQNQIKMKNKVSCKWMDPAEFDRHPLHIKAFLDPETKDYFNYHDSIDNFRKIKPVVYISVGNKKLVIDGWSYVLYANAKRMKTVLATEVTTTDDEATTRLMLELQHSHHNTSREEFKMYSWAFEMLSKGQGHRSDLKGSDWDKTEQKRSLSIYDKIAKMTFAKSGKRVEYILKVGKVNPDYFDRMDGKERMSLYAAFLNCKDEENGVMPEPPIPGLPEPVIRGSAVTVKDTTSVTSKGGNKHDLTNPAHHSAHCAKPAAEPAIAATSKNAGSEATASAPVIVYHHICTRCGLESDLQIHKD